jgi:Putative inner membrane exporter, YdcZ
MVSVAVYRSSPTATRSGLISKSALGPRDENRRRRSYSRTTFFTATTVTCSMVCSVLLDHFGWVGFEVHRVNPWRLVGCALLLAGLFLVSKF